MDDVARDPLARRFAYIAFSLGMICLAGDHWSQLVEGARDLAPAFAAAFFLSR